MARRKSLATAPAPVDDGIPFERSTTVVDDRPKLEPDRFHASPTNPRKTGLEAGQLVQSGLVGDIQRNGIRFSIEVRRLECDCGRCPGPQSGREGYEIVRGHRRWMAAVIAHLEMIPYVLWHGTDEEVLERQLAELASSESVSELEQADATKTLLDRMGSIEQVAGKLGKSTTWVQARLRLAATPASIRELFAAGRLNLGKLSLLGRIADPKLQESAAKAIADSEDGREYGKISMSKARQEIEKRLCVLSEAPWDKQDAELVPAAGACTTCPHSSDTQVDLLGELQSQKALCLKPSCFAAKTTAYVQLKLDKAKEKGQEVLTPGATKRLFSRPSQWDRDAKPQLKSADYVELSAPVPGDPEERTYAQLLGKSAKAAVVVAIDQRHKPRELIPAAKVKELAKAAGVDLPKPNAPASSSTNDPYKKHQEERALREKIWAIALKEIQAEVKNGGLLDPVALLRLLAVHLRIDTVATDAAHLAQDMVMHFADEKMYHYNSFDPLALGLAALVEIDLKQALSAAKKEAKKAESKPAKKSTAKDAKPVQEQD